MTPKGPLPPHPTPGGVTRAPLSPGGFSIVTWSVPVTASTWNPPKSGGSPSPHGLSPLTLVAPGAPVTPRCDTNPLHCSHLHQTLWLPLAEEVSGGFSDPSQPLSQPGPWLGLSLSPQQVPRPPQVTPGPSSTVTSTAPRAPRSPGCPATPHTSKTPKTPWHLKNTKSRLFSPAPAPGAALEQWKRRETEFQEGKPSLSLSPPAPGTPYPSPLPVLGSGAVPGIPAAPEEMESY